ncbi:MAG TPA: hypothetical protein VFJ56_03635 [Nitrospira sp.]|nr:hypothetical protein [Nitrospira sp.]
MKLRCAWCGGPIERPGHIETLDVGTSHGMCSTCSEALAREERGLSLQEHLDSILLPVLVIDESNTVAGMNATARALFGNAIDQESHYLGRVFDCLHSRSSEGCGRSIHCSGCAIRRSIMRTFDTGEAQTSVPATLSRSSPDQLSEAVLAVTTIKIGGLVLLRLE